MKYDITVFLDTFFDRSSLTLTATAITARAGIGQVKWERSILASKVSPNRPPNGESINAEAAELSIITSIRCLILLDEKNSEKHAKNGTSTSDLFNAI
jgi:hypothetical protein